MRDGLRVLGTLARQNGEWMHVLITPAIRREVIGIAKRLRRLAELGRSVRRDLGRGPRRVHQQPGSPFGNKREGGSPKTLNLST